MLAYICSRILSLALSLAVASVMIFAAIEVVPGDPAAFMLGLNAAPEAVAALRAELGLDGSLAERYLSWITGMLSGDFGTSHTYRVPVAELVADRLAVSVPLTLYAMLLSTAIALPVGIIAAARRGGPADLAVMGVTQLGIAIPNFWFAMLLVLVFAIGLRLFSAGGFPGWEAGLWPALKVDAIVPDQMVVEVRAGEALDAHQRVGAAEAVLRHAFRNALIPVMTILGLQFSFLLAGAIIIENVFFLPGLGRLIFQGITQRDLIVVESVVMLLVFAVILVTFLVDLAYAAVDPRLRRR